MLISNCCGASSWGHIDEVDMLGVCSDCKEHCEFIEEDELDD